MNLQSAHELYLPQIEAALQEIVHAASSDQASFYGMMRYHLGWADEALQPIVLARGKRIRPLLCLLACEAAGGDPRQALPAACALELVHNFSLVHDDIEDHSQTRRGRRAVWDLWGVAQAINVGDGLFVLAQMALHRLHANGVPLQRCQAAAFALDKACLALCEGQFQDMAFEDRAHVDLRHYLVMIRNKTAALLAASAQLGAIVATGDPEQTELYFRFGENLGMAFQIQDDILGIWGEEPITGKSTATDLRDKKKTLPVVYTLGLTPAGPASLCLSDLYAQPGPLDEAAIGSALEALDQVGARAYAEDQAQGHYAQAIQSLDQTGLSGAAQAALRELATTLLKRKA